MRKSLKRIWEGTGIEEFKDASIDAYILLIEEFEDDILSIFNSRSVYRYIDIRVKSGDHEYKIYWSNYMRNITKSKFKFACLQSDIIHCFDCETIDSFKICVDLFEE